MSDTAHRPVDRRWQTGDEKEVLRYRALQQGPGGDRIQINNFVNRQKQKCWIITVYK